MPINNNWDNETLLPKYRSAQENYRNKKNQLLAYLQQQTDKYMGQQIEKIEEDLIKRLNIEYGKIIDGEDAQSKAAQDKTSKLFFDDVNMILREVDFTIPEELRKKIIEHIKNRQKDYSEKSAKLSKEYHRSQSELEDELRNMRRALANYLNTYLANIFKVKISEYFDKHPGTSKSGAFFSSIDQIKSSFINSVIRGYAVKNFDESSDDESIVKQMNKFGKVGYSRILKTGNEVAVSGALSNIFEGLGVHAVATGQVKRKAENIKIGVEIGSDALLFILDDRTKKIKDDLDNTLAKGGEKIIFDIGWDSQNNYLQKMKKFVKDATSPEMKTVLSQAMGVNAKAWKDFSMHKRDSDSHIFENVLKHGGMSLGSKAIASFIPNDTGGRGTQPYKDNLLACANYIVEILGVRNIFFVTGTNFYFMDEFIQKIIDNKLFIQIQTHWDTKAPGLNYRYWVVDNLNAQELNYNKWRRAQNITYF